MPNWTYNSATVTGSTDKLKELRKAIQNADDTVDITKINPIPNVFNNMHSGSRTIDGIRYSLWIEHPDGTVQGVDENGLSKILKLTGARDSIDWQYKNWGTKWGDCSTKITEIDDNRLLLTFESAWGEPFLLIDDLANKFDVHISNTWQVEFEDEPAVSTYPMTALKRDDYNNNWANDLDKQHEQMVKYVESIKQEEE